MARPRRRIFILHASHHLTDHHFNGDGLVAWGFINELAKRGHRMHVATDRLDVRSTLPSNVTLTEFPRTFENPLLHYVSYLRRVRKYFENVKRGEGVDIVHQMNPVVRGLSLAVVDKRVPVVLGTYVGDWVQLEINPYRVRQTPARKVTAAVKAGLDAVQQHFATSLVLATPHALQRIPLRARMTEKIEGLHHGVDTDLYDPNPRDADRPPRARTILYVGSFHGQKGVMTLVEAFGLVAAAVPDARIVFVGSGDMQGAMEERLAQLELSGRAEFPGRATRAEVASWMRACSVICAPSYGEPYGQNVLEAMATGRPVVITTEGGHRYLSDPKGKIAVVPGDIAGLGAALVSVLSDAALWNTMSRVNRSLAEQLHAWPRATDGLEDIYERAIARFSVPGARTTHPTALRPR